MLLYIIIYNLLIFTQLFSCSEIPFYLTIKKYRQMSRWVLLREAVNMASSNSTNRVHVFDRKLLALPHVGAVEQVSVSVRAFFQGCLR